MQIAQKRARTMPHNKLTIQYIYITQTGYKRVRTRSPQYVHLQSLATFVDINISRSLNKRVRTITVRDRSLESKLRIDVINGWNIATNSSNK